MRKNLSLVFFVLASALILLQLVSSFTVLNREQRQNQVLHSISRQITEQTISPDVSKPQLDYQKLAEDLTDIAY